LLAIEPKAVAVRKSDYKEPIILMKQKQLVNDAREAAAFLIGVRSRIHTATPSWCCNHECPPCLRCAVEYLVENAPKVGVFAKLDAVVSHSRQETAVKPAAKKLRPICQGEEECALFQEPPHQSNSTASLECLSREVLGCGREHVPNPDLMSRKLG
jgi:hypothetical protein